MKTHKNLSKNVDLPRDCIVRAAQIALFGVALTAIAHAQQTSGDSSAQQLPKIKVEEAEESAAGPVPGYTAKRSATGAKTNTAIIETPQSISVITADRMEALGASRLKEALAYTPGINASPWGNESQYDWIYLRGFDAYSPGFYLDGQQLRNSGSWGVWQTENYGTERIEVLRGPSSVLYGLNGPGGMVNVVSKRPTAEPMGEFRAQFGEDSRRQVAADLSGPLGSGDVLYRFTALAQDAELSTGDDLRNDRQFVAPALTWLLSEQTQLTVLSQFLRIRSASVWSSYPAIGTLTPNPNGRIPVDTFIGEPDFNRYDQDQWTLGYLFEHRFDDTWTLRQNARYGEFETDYRTFYGVRFATVNAANPADPANFRLLNRTPFKSDEKAAAFTVDNQLQAALHLGAVSHTLLAGVDHQRTRMDVVAYYGGTADPIDAYSPSYGGRVTLTTTTFIDAVNTLKQTGFYVQDQIKFGDGLVATLGGRYDRSSVATDSGSGSKFKENEFTSRAGLVYLAPGGWAPYASYSESFSPLTTIDPATGEPFDPETGRQYEVGVRYQPSGRSDSYSLAAFDLRRQNYVTYDSASVPHQTGEVTMRGLELEAVFQPMPSVNVITAYTWMPKAEVTASSNAATIGKQLTPVSEHLLSLWGDYRFDFGLKLGLGARYVGSHRGYSETAPRPVPDYTLVDALISYDLGSWTMAINARNLTDKEYVATCSGANCSYGETRNVMATGTYRW